ncbi:hypothetical protein QJS66_17125 [Kocuria rhizophila]|nr:hypothetical protein QJS66_17125 [Kocuria rhizophila]
MLERHRDPRVLTLYYTGARTSAAGDVPSPAHVDPGAPCSPRHPPRAATSPPHPALTPPARARVPGSHRAAGLRPPPLLPYFSTRPSWRTRADRALQTAPPRVCSSVRSSCMVGSSCGSPWPTRRGRGLLRSTASARPARRSSPRSSAFASAWRLGSRRSPAPAPSQPGSGSVEVGAGPVPLIVAASAGPTCWPARQRVRDGQGCKQRTRRSNLRAPADSSTHWWRLVDTVNPRTIAAPHHRHQPAVRLLNYVLATLSSASWRW